MPIGLRKDKISKRLAFLLLALALVACSQQAVYEEYVEVNDQGWYKDSVLSFTVSITDTSVPYQLMLYFRNNDQYEYSNIYFFRSVSSDRGIEFADTVDYTVADAYGKWLGKGVGEVKTHEWPYSKSAVYFKEAGNYTFQFQQAMREENLIGIESVGLGIFKANTNQDD